MRTDESSLSGKHQYFSWWIRVCSEFLWTRSHYSPKIRIAEVRWSDMGVKSYGETTKPFITWKAMFRGSRGWEWGFQWPVRGGWLPFNALPHISTIQTFTMYPDYWFNNNPKVLLYRGSFQYPKMCKCRVVWGGASSGGFVRSELTTHHPPYFIA